MAKRLAAVMSILFDSALFHLRMINPPRTRSQIAFNGAAKSQKILEIVKNIVIFSYCQKAVFLMHAQINPHYGHEEQRCSLIQYR